jgi:PAS domain S-box-containing protein
LFNQNSMPKAILNRSILLFSVTTVVLIGGISYWIYQVIAENERSKVADSLHAVLDTTHQAINSWVKEQKTVTEVWTKSLEVKQAAGALLASHRSKQALINHPVQATLRKQLKSVIIDNNFKDFFIIDRNNFSIASSIDENIGIKNLLAEQDAFLRSIWSGKVAVSLPVISDLRLPDKNKTLHEDLAAMFVGAAIKDENGKLIAALIFRINPQNEFTLILQKGHLGTTGETYAFDKEGRLISNSLFEDQLHKIDLLEPGQSSILNIEIRDPGVNLLKKSQNKEKNDWPLTRMALSATSGESGLDINGYRDYRGVLVVGAWYWDKDLGFAVATEVDHQEAFKNLGTVRVVNLSLTVLTILLTIGVAVNLFISRKLRETDDALRLANEKLEEKVRLRTSDLKKVNDKLRNEIIEREQIQLTLREERDLAEGLINTARAIILVLDPEARIVRFNKYMEELSGYTQEEVKGKDWFKTFLPDSDQKNIKNLFTKAIHDTPTQGNINPIVTKQGCKCMVEWYDRTLKDASGNIVGLLAIGHDVTERIRTEKNSGELLKQNRNLMQRMFRIQEDERKSISRELHDEFGQWLTAIQLDAQNITNQIGDKLPELSGSIDSIINGAAHLQKDMRTMIHDLRPAILDELGLRASLEDLVGHWQEHNPGIQCNLSFVDELDEIDKELQINIFRLVQEALTNITRYASADKVDIRFEWIPLATERKGVLIVTIVDDGIGFDIMEQKENRLGILGMRERVLSVGGEFSIESEKGKGVRIKAQFDIDHENLKSYEQ